MNDMNGKGRHKPPLYFLPLHSWPKGEGVIKNN